jgi:hypothetical protein
VVTPGGLEFIEPFIDLQTYNFQFNDYTADVLGVGVWRDLTIDFSQGPDAGALVASDIGFQVYATSPGLVEFVVDSIWVE